MANFQSTSYESSLAEVWKNYFDLWIDPPYCVTFMVEFMEYNK